MASEKSIDETIGNIARANGFTLDESKTLVEIDGVAHVMKHDLSGARLLYLQNEDSNKSFSITFKTPAADDTGVFHILEHSVLCGSEKFPVKEPFVNLLKSSMQTFLNAMTFPDKTMYPVASTNEKDLMNLMDVYLDAVFHPNIYSRKTIFEQEGWHLEFVSDTDALSDADDLSDASNDGSLASDSDGKLVYNGVVFNEMKGALSDPDSVLFDTLSAALFPDTTYRFESGGTPEAIPTLTYEAFLDSHRRHYRPDNSYIILYGDLDLDKFLGFIDKKYLNPIASAPDYRPISFEETDGTCISMRTNPLDIQKPVCIKGVKKEMVTSKDNSCAALGFVIGRAKEREKIIAVDILMDAIMGSNVSPLKKALIDAQIANDCAAHVVDSMAQPFVMVSAKSLKADAVAKLERVVHDEVCRLSGGGLDKNLVRAALSHAEFVMREQNFGYPDGVVLSMSAMNGWLYDEDMAYDYIAYEDVFASLRAKLDTDYFENLLSEVFLNNDHKAQVEVVPVESASDDVLKKRLDALQASLDPEKITQIKEDLEALRQAQSTPDSPKDLAKLPRLAISDIGQAPSEPAFKTKAASGVKYLLHEVPTHGIAYFYRYYPLDSVPFDDFPYISVLASILGKLDTCEHTAIELDTAVQENLGSLSFIVQVHEAGMCENDNELRPQFMVGTSALKENCSSAAHLIREIVSTTKFDDASKIFDILIQRRTMMEQKFAVAGNSFAVSRATSYYSPASVIREYIDGIDFYRFLKDITDNYEEKSAHLIDKLQQLASVIFKQDAMLSFAGDEASLEEYLSVWQEGLMAPEDILTKRYLLEVPAPEKKKEAFIAPCDVTFSASSFDRAKVSDKLTGPWLVASRILTYDYLWNEVRVVGGAYGVGFTTTRQGQSYFYSYRDPHIDETIERFDASAEWLASFSPSKDAFDGFIVSTASTFDAPLKPRALIRRQDAMFFSDYTPKERLELREQVINATVDDVVSLGASIGKLCESAALCCVGNKAIIESSKTDWDIIDLFG